MLEELYQDLLLQHAKSPAHRGELEAPSTQHTLHNPLCGDEVSIAIKIEGGKIVAAKFSGHGCMVSQAAASMLTDRLIGLTLNEANHLADDFRSVLKGERNLSEEDQVRFGDLVALEGVKRFPVRIKCALLSFDVVEKLLNLKEKE